MQVVETEGNNNTNNRPSDTISENGPCLIDAAQGFKT